MRCCGPLGASAGCRSGGGGGGGGLGRCAGPDGCGRLRSDGRSFVSRCGGGLASRGGGASRSPSADCGMAGPALSMSAAAAAAVRYILLVLRICVSLFALNSLLVVPDRGAIAVPAPGCGQEASTRAILQILGTSGRFPNVLVSGRRWRQGEDSPSEYQDARDRSPIPRSGGGRDFRCTVRSTALTPNCFISADRRLGLRGVERRRPAGPERCSHRRWRSPGRGEQLRWVRDRGRAGGQETPSRDDLAMWPLKS